MTMIHVGRRPRGSGPATCRMPAVEDVGEPGAGEPHARFEVAGAGNGAKNLITGTEVGQPTGRPAEHEGLGPLPSEEVTAPASDPTATGLLGTPSVR
jgi:hypothetical protein